MSDVLGSLATSDQLGRASISPGLSMDRRRSGWLVVPFGATHQHFNTGQTTARYFSAMSVHLEHMCGLHRHTWRQPSSG